MSISLLEKRERSKISASGSFLWDYCTPWAKILQFFIDKSAVAVVFLSARGYN